LVLNISPEIFPSYISAPAPQLHALRDNSTLFLKT